MYKYALIILMIVGSLSATEQNHTAPSQRNHFNICRHFLTEVLPKNLKEKEDFNALKMASACAELLKFEMCAKATGSSEECKNYELFDNNSEQQGIIKQLILSARRGHVIGHFNDLRQTIDSDPETAENDWSYLRTLCTNSVRI